MKRETPSSAGAEIRSTLQQLNGRFDSQTRISLILVPFSFLLGWVGTSSWVPEGVRSYFFDSEFFAPVVTVFWQVFLKTFLLEIGSIILLLWVIALLRIWAASMRGFRKVRTQVPAFLLLISAVPSFVLALAVQAAGIGGSRLFPVLLVSLTGNLVLYVFVRSQQQFLIEELQQSYVQAARISGGSVWRNIRSQFVTHTWNSISALIPVVVASLVVSERVLNFQRGFANFVLQGFSRYLASPKAFPAGISYLVILILLTLFVQALLKLGVAAASLLVLTVRKRGRNPKESSPAYGAYSGRVQPLLGSHLVVHTWRGDSSYAISGLEFGHDRRLYNPLRTMRVTVRSIDSNQPDIYARFADWSRSVMYGLTQFFKVGKIRALVVSILLIIIAFTFVQGTRGHIVGSYLYKVKMEENRLRSIRDPEKSYYTAFFDNGQLKLSREFMKPVNLSAEEELPAAAEAGTEIRTAAEASADPFDALGGLFTSSADDLESANKTDSDLTAQQDMNRHEELERLRALGFSSWSPGRLRESFDEKAGPVNFMPLGTTKRGTSVTGDVIRAMSKYIEPLILLIITAGGLGMLLALMDSYALVRRSRNNSTMFHIISYIDAVPRFLFVLALLPLAGNARTSSGYMLMVFFVMGLAFVPTVYKVLHARIAAYSERGFITAELMMGNPLYRVVIYHIFIKNSFFLIIHVLLQVVGFAVMIESTLGFLDFVQQRYVSLGSLIPPRIDVIKNPWELFGPVGAIVLIIFTVYLLQEVMEAANKDGVQ
jgi:ABC-type dipeptide/oligopeptide/nickel transport system permease subunit